MIFLRVSSYVVEYTTPELEDRFTRKKTHAPFPAGYVDDVNYDASVKAFAFLLNQSCNVAIDRVRTFLSDVSDGKIQISNGMICNLTKQFSRMTEAERNELFLKHPIDQMLEVAYPSLLKTNSAALPIWYYIYNAGIVSELAYEKAPKLYSDIVTSKCINRHAGSARGRNAIQIWNEEKRGLPRALRLISNLPEEKAPVEQLEFILRDIFEGNPDILEDLKGPDRSSLRKLIRSYDFLKYANKKAP